MNNRLDSLQTMPLAMAYVPWQQWQNVYEGSVGLMQGTIFEELIFPFQYASRVCTNNGNCRSNDRMNRNSRERCSRERTEQYGRRCEAYDR